MSLLTNTKLGRKVNGWRSKRKGHHFYDLRNLLDPNTIVGSLKPKSEVAYDMSYINLDERTERRDHIEKTFSGYGIERYSAVKVSGEDDFRKRFPHLQDLAVDESIFEAGRNGWGIVGSYTSHRALLEQIDNMEGWTLIFEDDVVIYTRAFFGQVDQVLHNGGSNFDILLFDPQGPYKQSDQVARNLYRPSAGFPSYWGCHAYAIKNSSKQQILDYLDKRKVYYYDLLMLEKNAEQEIDVGAYRTSLCRPGGKFGSDLAT